MVHNVQVRQNRRRLWPLFSSPSSPSLISSPSSPSSFYICEIIFWFYLDFTFHQSVLFVHRAATPRISLRCFSSASAVSFASSTAMAEELCELHCHLDGSIRPATFLELHRNLPSPRYDTIEAAKADLCFMVMQTVFPLFLSSPLPLSRFSFFGNVKLAR